LSGWDLEDRQIFHTAFAQFGKNFEKIQCWLKGKSMKQIIEFYYHSKATGGLTEPTKVFMTHIMTNNL